EGKSALLVHAALLCADEMPPDQTAPSARTAQRMGDEREDAGDQRPPRGLRRRWQPRVPSAPARAPLVTRTAPVVTMPATAAGAAATLHRSSPRATPCPCLP